MLTINVNFIFKITLPYVAAKNKKTYGISDICGITIIGKYGIFLLVVTNQKKKIETIPVRTLVVLGVFGRYPQISTAKIILDSCFAHIFSSAK